MFHRRALLPLSLSLLSVACGGDPSAPAGASSSGGHGGSGGASSTATGADGGSTASTSNGSTSTSSAGGSGGAGSTGSATSSSSSSAAGTGGSGGGAPAACNGLTKGPGDSDGMIVSSGTMRTFHIHAPPGYVNSKSTPLVFVFHGVFEADTDVENVSQMDPKADAHNFLAVYPQGLNTSWNAGTCCLASQSAMVPDVQFVKDLLDQLETDYCVDKKRVYAAGFSNGAMLSHRLGCEMADRFAAIGPVSGTLQFSPCTPSRPVPVIDFHGNGDLVVPYNGGGFGNNISVADTIAAWVKNDACADAMPAQVYKQGDATCVEYSQCLGGAAVRLCTIEQGGHQWPGGKSVGPLNGNLSTDIDAAEEISKFFLAHPMP